MNRARLLPVLLLIPLAVSGCPIENVLPKQPRPDTLIHRVSIPLNAQNGFTYHDNEDTTYQGPNADGDCSPSSAHTHRWKLGPTDSIIVHLTSMPGIPPGPGNARGFILQLRNSDNGQDWALTMMQAATAQDYLIHEKWALFADAVENVSAEVGNGLTIAPPPPQRGWPRRFLLGTVGGTWTLRPQAPIVMRDLAATVTVHTTAAVQVCR